MSTAAKKTTDNHDVEDACGCPLIPAEVRRAFRQAEPYRTGEERLWRLVAARIVLDTVGVTGFGPIESKRHIDAVVEAQKWWHHEWDYAREVFDRANVCIDGIRELMSEFYMDEHNRVVRFSFQSKAVRNEVHQAERSSPGTC